MAIDPAGGSQLTLDDLIVVPSPSSASKWCEWCKETKPIHDFGRMRRSKDGRQQICRVCFARNWRKNHNIENAPPKRRFSPYDVIDMYLRDIEVALGEGDLRRAYETIAKCREDLHL